MTTDNKRLIDCILSGKLKEAKELFDTLAKDRLNSELDEVKKVVVKVTAKGQKTRKVKCGQGYKNVGGSCVPQGSSEKLAKKKAIRQAVKTKRAAGEGEKRKATKKRLKALKKRRSMGL